MNSSNKKPTSVLIMGPYGAGKKTLINIAKYGDSAKQIPLIGIDFEKLTIDNNHLLIWSIGGRSGYRALWNRYYSRMSAFIFVVDSSDQEATDQAKEQLHHLTNDENFQGKPLLIFANKQDLPKAMNTDQLRDRLDLEKLGENVQWHLQLVSAIQNQGLREGFNWLITSIGKKNDLENPLLETVNDDVEMKSGLISRFGIDKVTGFVYKFVSLSFDYMGSITKFMNFK